MSTTHKDINDCIFPSKISKWQTADVLADESKSVSQHGKMKCEGVYELGYFKAVKMYRLYESLSDDSSISENVLTRCKGSSRQLANIMLDECFDVASSQQFKVTRICLRPTQAGEITLRSETKTLMNSVNFKRFVTSDGLHSLPLSYSSMIDCD